MMNKTIPLSKGKAQVQERRPQPGMPTPADEIPDLDLEEQDIELDYSAMDARSRIVIPTQVDWKNVLISKKSYLEIFNITYELDVEEEL